MIFVTVGTTVPFDDLIKEVDSLAEHPLMAQHDIICQIGNGEYIPKNCQHFRFRDTLDDLVEQASLLICHGGTGSTMNAITSGKPFIIVTNKQMKDNHQEEFLLALSEYADLPWTNDPAKLLQLIERVRSSNHKVDLKLPNLYGDLIQYIKS